MTGDELLELYRKVTREYRRYVRVMTTGDGDLDQARNDWLVWQAELSAAATPEDIRRMLNVVALENRKAVKR